MAENFPTWNNPFFTFSIPCVVGGLIPLFPWAQMIIFGVNAGTLEGQGCCNLPCCLYYLTSLFFGCGLVAAPTRHAIIKKYGLDEESYMHSCLLHTFCFPCALGQEYTQMQDVNNTSK